MKRQTFKWIDEAEESFKIMKESWQKHWFFLYQILLKFLNYIAMLQNLVLEESLVKKGSLWHSLVRS